VVERRYADDFVLEEGRWGGILKKKKKEEAEDAFSMLGSMIA
jgi:hypothetical protein